MADKALSTCQTPSSINRLLEVGAVIRLSEAEEVAGLLGAEVDTEVQNRDDLLE